jgi:hypothetical protein
MSIPDQVLFILVALALIVFIRVGYYQLDSRDRIDESIPVTYITPLVFDDIGIRLLSFSAYLRQVSICKPQWEKDCISKKHSSFSA